MALDVTLMFIRLKPFHYLSPELQDQFLDVDSNWESTKPLIMFERLYYFQIWITVIQRKTPTFVLSCLLHLGPKTVAIWCYSLNSGWSKAVI